MANPTSIKNEMHVASGDQLLVLKDEADDMVVENPVLLNYFLRHVYREYNRRRYYNHGGTSMIEPYDGGFTPINYEPSAGSFVLLESGDKVLLEDGSFVMLEF